MKFHVANALLKLGLGSRAEPRRWRGVPADSALAARTQRGSGGSEKATMADSTLRLGPIGQVAWHVSDVASAAEWYATVLGLPHLYTFGDLAFFDRGGVRLFLSEGENGAGEPSVLYFRVPDINAAYDELTARGVVFEGRRT